MGIQRLNMVAFFMVIGIAVLQMQSSYAQKTHTVGDSTGWTVPQTGAAFYTTWAASQTFAVGDVLVFNFTTGSHTAAQVTKAAFDACTTTNPISVSSTGPASVTLNSSGLHYFLCQFPGHCSLGQKLAITVAGAGSQAPTPTGAPPTTTPVATPPPASPTTSPPPSSPSGGSPPPASGPGSSGAPPPPGVTSTPTPPNSASFIAAALPVTFFSIAVALFY